MTSKQNNSKDLTTSRRQFVKLATGAALALRHGLSAAQASGRCCNPKIGIEDSHICIEWNSALHSRVWRIEDGRRQALTGWDASDYVQDGDQRHIVDFALTKQSREAVEDMHGRAERLRVSGVSAGGVAKTLEVTLYERHPGFAIVRVSYTNTTSKVLTLRGWTQADHRITAHGHETPAFWCYSGASYQDRRDWIQPIAAGTEQDNFLGMEASDYGGGTPIVDVWHRRGGLAVGHVEITPRRVSLPVHGERDAARIAVCGRDRLYLKPGESFAPADTFVAAHGGDHFATLEGYRRFMAERGMIPAAAGASSYEAIWCAWGYERACTTALIEGTLPKVRELGLKWAVIDDGWQKMIGDWTPDLAKYPQGAADIERLSADIRARGLKPRLWYSPLSVAPGSDALHDHPDRLLLDRDGAVQKISWWNSFYLCPAYEGTLESTRALIRKFIGEWRFSGLKIDGQHLNGVAPCFNPAHHHARPEDSVEGLQNYYKVIYDTAKAIDPEVVIELCPCGTAYSAFNFPYMNQAPASDPESSWQVRHKGKTLKGLMGPSAPFAGDHVELSDHHDDFASTVGVGAVVSTKFTWPVDPKPKDSFLLTPDKEREWRRWIELYDRKMLPLGTYRGALYDIGFDRPEAHAVEKDGRMHYAFYAERWSGPISLRGLAPGTYRIRDYVNERELGTVQSTDARIPVTFERFLLIEAIPT